MLSLIEIEGYFSRSIGIGGRFMPMQSMSLDPEAYLKFENGYALLTLRLFNADTGKEFGSERQYTLQPVFEEL